MTTEEERKLRSFCDQNVLYCVSSLISELIEKAEHFPDYTEDLYNLTMRPATEEEEAEGYDEPTEVLEHWIVSNWLADRLEEKGESVAKDLFGLTIWGRTTTGQSITLDCVFREIFEEHC